ADPAIVEDLERRGLLLRAETIEHTYPLCWRCDTPLMYVARPAWYVRTTALKDRLLEVHERVNWFPGHIKHDRYGDWQANNVVCLGHIIDAEGRKMSKRLGNIIDPFAAIDRFGADAVRWFFVAGGSPWAARRVSMEAFEDVVRRFLLTLWNTFAFFVTYANID